MRAPILLGTGHGAAGVPDVLRQVSRPRAWCSQRLTRPRALVNLATWPTTVRRRLAIVQRWRGQDEIPTVGGECVLTIRVFDGALGTDRAAFEASALAVAAC